MFQGGFPLSRKSYVRTDVDLKKIRSMCEPRARVRKRKKLNSAQLFTFTHAVHTSRLILFTYVKPAKSTSVRT